MAYTSKQLDYCTKYQVPSYYMYRRSAQCSISFTCTLKTRRVKNYLTSTTLLLLQYTTCTNCIIDMCQIRCHFFDFKFLLTLLIVQYGGNRDQHGECSSSQFGLVTESLFSLTVFRVFFRFFSISLAGQETHFIYKATPRNISHE